MRRLSLAVSCSTSFGRCIGSACLESTGKLRSSFKIKNKKDNSCELNMKTFERHHLCDEVVETDIYRDVDVSETLTFADQITR